MTSRRAWGLRQSLHSTSTNRPSGVTPNISKNTEGPDLGIVSSRQIGTNPAVPGVISLSGMRSDWTKRTSCNQFSSLVPPSALNEVRSSHLALAFGSFGNVKERNFVPICLLIDAELRTVAMNTERSPNWKWNIKVRLRRYYVWTGTFSGYAEEHVK